MPKSKSSYSKGLNQDNSRSKRMPGSYYDALNLKVITHDGLSTGSIENEKGNSFAFKFPYVPRIEYTHPDGTKTEMFAHPNIRIVGWCSVDKYIVIFTKGNPKTGLIWKLEYNEQTNKVKNVGVTGELNVTDHLIYNGKLNFKTENRIESEGRYENDKVIRVYWTDNFNPLRSVNIMDPELINTKPDLLDGTPNLTFSMPYVISVGNGSLQANTKIQYAYRLISKEGTQTDLSPYSQLVTLTGTLADKLDNYSTFRNKDIDGRSVTFRVEGIDTDYKVIQHIAIHHKTKDDITVYQFQEDDIPPDGKMDVVITGDEQNVVGLTATQASAVSSGFDVCKTIDAKNNYLIAGNIKKQPSQINTDSWDSRAYRFKHVDDSTDNISKCDLQDERGVVTLVDKESSSYEPDWDSVPITHDAINLYNTEKEDYYWHNQHQYKYQKDGKTLGGSGKFISYEFTWKTITLDVSRNFVQETQTKKAPWIDAEEVTGDYSTGIINADGTANEYNVIGQYENFTSPIIESLYTGYSRGEVYRFGIQFYTKKGAATYVNWIGDIKFPDPDSNDDFYDTYQVGYERSDRILGKSLGIKFKIDVTEIEDQIGGYRIVRAERTEPNVSRLGTGVIMHFDRQGEHTVLTSGRSGGHDEQYSTLYESLDPERQSGGQIRTGSNYIEWRGGTIGRDALHLPDCPGFNMSSQWPQGKTKYSAGVHGKSLDEGVGARAHTIFFSSFTTEGIRDTGPLKFNHEVGDYLKTIGYYESAAHMYGKTGDENNNGNSKPKKGNPYKQQKQSWVWKCRKWKRSNHDSEAFPIDFVRYMNYVEQGYNTKETGAPHYLYNFSYGEANSKKDKYKFPLGIGHDICHIELYQWYGDVNSRYPDTTFKAAQFMSHYNNTRQGIYSVKTYMNTAKAETISWGTRGDGGSYGRERRWHFKEVSYVRQILKQYGGDTFEARSKTIYMSTGHYQPITGISSQLVTRPRVFGGDVVVYMYGKEYIYPYVNETVQDNDNDIIKHYYLYLSVSVMFPCESRINMAFNTGNGYQFMTDRDNGKNSERTREVYGHMEVFLQQNNSEKKFIAKDFATTEVEEFPHRLWISKEKTDGELIDSWKDFSENNVLDVDGSYGPINRVINFQDRLVFYQDHAIGIAAINETSIANDNDGVDIVLGTGTVLESFRYMTTETGTVHQYSVTPSTTALYHYDATLRKLFKLTNTPASLSDMKGMSSFFAENVDELIVVLDKTLLNTASATFGINKPTGVHSVFDPRHNRILFTFLSPKQDKANFTIGYNEYMDAFESFYSYVPNIYLNTGRRLLSVDPDQSITGPSSDRDQVYLHDDGDYGSFYGNVANTEITLIIAPDADIPKIFTNIEYNSEISIDGNPLLLPDAPETLSSVEIWNDYQTTGKIDLIVGTNIKRRIRHWRHVIGRDTNSSDNKARIRDYSIYLKLARNNNNNKRLVLHDVIITYTPARD